MLNSFTISESTTFTVTHARHMVAKVATDLKRLQRLYGRPSDSDIAAYEEEAIVLMKAGYLNYIWYGFRCKGYWIEPTLRYTAQEIYGGTVDDDPGKIRPGANISGASFSSYLSYTSTWDVLTSSEKDVFKKGLPIYRNGADEPSVNGYLASDKTYSSGGRSLERSIVRSF